MKGNKLPNHHIIMKVVNMPNDVIMVKKKVQMLVTIQICPYEPNNLIRYQETYM